MKVCVVSCLNRKIRFLIQIRQTITAFVVRIKITQQIKLVIFIMFLLYMSLSIYELYELLLILCDSDIRPFKLFDLYIKKKYILFYEKIEILCVHLQDKCFTTINSTLFPPPPPFFASILMSHQKTYCKASSDWDVLSLIVTVPRLFQYICIDFATYLCFNFCT